MNEKARRIASRLPIAEKEDYEGVKRILLQAFQMTPKTYKARFTDADRRPDETWIQFYNRLECLFTYYLNSWEVTNLGGLKQLMISDKLKDVMAYRLRKYILGKEGTEWMRPQEVARAADTYTANMGEKSFTDSRPKPTTETHGVKNSSMKSNTHSNSSQGIKGPTRLPQPVEGERREGAWRDRN